MIFVSYSHQDEIWRKRFEIMSKPLSRAEGIRFWSDRNLKAGPWEAQLHAAIQDAVAAVLLVSDNFLASDYIMESELPYLMRAHQSRGLMIIWAYLDPCDVKRFPQITRFQAMTNGELRALSAMTPWEAKQTMLRGCEMLDDFLKQLEVPALNTRVNGTAHPRVSKVPLLATPARRRVEVLVYSRARRWCRQASIAPGGTTTTIHLGDEKTPRGTTYPVIAMTTEAPLTRQTYANLPDYRTKTKELQLVRA